MSEASRPMLSEVELFRRTLRNRLAVAPMSRVSATVEGLAMPDWPLKIAKSEPVVAFDDGMISPSASIENTTHGMDSSVVAFIGMLRGENFGKTMVRIS